MLQFRSLIVDKQDEDVEAAVQTMEEAKLPEGDLLIRVAYSSINYKDALALEPDGRIVSRYPLIPGIDAAGVVEKSSERRLPPGTKVIVTGHGFGVSQHGGYSEYARIPAEWAVPLPKGLTTREAMALGTAGLTAAMSIQKLEDGGVKPGSGPVVVTGASGGVGTLAVSMLAGLGYEVEAVSGKPEAAELLRELGAARILAREELLPAEQRPLDKQRWAGAVDCVGGAMLTNVLSRIQYGGTAACCGLTGGLGADRKRLPVHPAGSSALRHRFGVGAAGAADQAMEADGGRSEAPRPGASHSRGGAERCCRSGSGFDCRTLRRAQGGPDRSSWRSMKQAAWK